MRGAFRHLTRARLPIFGCAGFILFLFAANLWNLAVERDWPKLRIRSDSPLAGVAKPRPAPWTLADFLSGETQKAASSNLGQSLPAFSIAVRAKNQLVFSLFGDSGADGVVIGRNAQLYETIYINEYCGRAGRKPNPLRIDLWAREIRAVQAAAQAAGQRLVYVLSPTKPSHYPDDLPASAPCAGRVMPDKLAPYRAALVEQSVRFMDGPRLIEEKKADYAIPLFPRGGTHWGAIAAGLALREITQLAPEPLGVFDFAWSASPVALGTDRDLIDLLNLLRPDLSYPTAIIARAGPPGNCGRTPRLIAMGGSFLHEILAAATLARCPPQIDYWFYMRTVDGDRTELGHYFRPPGDASNGERQSAASRILDENLRDADLILLEENETNISRTPQIGHILAGLRRIAPDRPFQFR